ncbi:MBL fold metallo-hydrolase [Yersinia ruckeri]|nr:MBL fold metallo-hydrolase [Yersinia ruckeri]
MTIRYEVLKANHGDSILVSYAKDDVIFNLLIDGGPAKTFSGCLFEQGPLKKILGDLDKKEQVIDLLILTHVDDDHIGGLLEGFRSQSYLSKLTKRVWFNSGGTIEKHFKVTSSFNNELHIKAKSSRATSIKQGVFFEEYISGLNIWDKVVISSNDQTYNIGPMKFIILSPCEDNLKKLLVKWEKEVPVRITSAKGNDYNSSFDELLESDNFEEDKSIHNGSSIAFILEVENYKMIFLGDAHPSTIINKLKVLGYSRDNPIEADLVKISHHGSKYNTNSELLDIIKSDNYIISTDGSKHGLPHKVCLARIYNSNPRAKILFNYPHLIPKIFKSAEIDRLKENIGEIGRVEMP